MVIVQEEAKTVKRIYREFMEGYSAAQIAQNLMSEDVPTACGKKKWYPRTILNILENEKYKGCVRMCKTYKPDVLSPKRLKNDKDQVASYYLEDSHRAIISKKVFEGVQAELIRRNKMRSCTEKGVGKFSSKYAFSTILICGNCGNRFRRHAHYYKGEMVPKWVCGCHQLHSDQCDMPPIRESVLQDSFLKAIKELTGNISGFMETLNENIVTSIDSSAVSKLTEIINEIESLQEKMLQLNKDKRSGKIREESYLVKAAEIGERIDILTEEQKTLQSKTDEVMLSKYRLEEITKILGQADYIKKFNIDIFKALVEKIKILGKDKIEIEYKCGIKKVQNLN